MERRVPITVTKKPKNASVNKNVAQNYQETDHDAIHSYSATIDPIKLKKYLKNSEKLNDNNLDNMVQLINRRSQQPSLSRKF